VTGALLRALGGWLVIGAVVTGFCWAVSGPAPRPAAPWRICSARFAAPHAAGRPLARLPGCPP